MLGAVRREGLTAARVLLASGLIASAGLLSAVGGWWGLGIGVIQVAVSTAVVLRPRSTGPLGGAVLSLVPAPLAAVRHWTAGLPVGCRCSRLPHPPPGLVSLTGLVVALDATLIGLTICWTAARRQARVGKSSP